MNHQEWVEWEKETGHAIDDKEMAEDIFETEREISIMAQEADAWERLPMLPEHRLDHMRASSRRSGIETRKKFISELREIIKFRHESEK